MGQMKYGRTQLIMQATTTRGTFKRRVSGIKLIRYPQRQKYWKTKKLIYICTNKMLKL